MGSLASKEDYNLEIEKAEKKLGRSLNNSEKDKIREEMDERVYMLRIKQEINKWEKHIDKAIEFESHCYVTGDSSLVCTEGMKSIIERIYSSKGYHVELSSLFDFEYETDDSGWFGENVQITRILWKKSENSNTETVDSIIKSVVGEKFNKDM